MMLGSTTVAYAHGEADDAAHSTPTATNKNTASSQNTLQDMPAGSATKAKSTAGTAATGTTTDKSKFLFEDDFEGTAGSLPDKDKWIDYSACTHGPPAAYGMIRCGDDETLDGSGHLVVPAGPDFGTSLMTKNKFDFQYGTVSAWIQLPKEVGYWPAFWTLNDPATEKSRSDILVGEIDVMEGYTTWPTATHSGLHAWHGKQLWGGDDNLCEQNVDLTASFHKYSAKVEPHAISFYVDDKQCGKTITPEHPNAVGKPWPFGPDMDRGNWLILTVAVGGAAGQQKPATEPTRMLVDRVEVAPLPGNSLPGDMSGSTSGSASGGKSVTKSDTKSAAGSDTGMTAMPDAPDTMTSDTMTSNTMTSNTGPAVSNPVNNTSTMSDTGGNVANDTDTMADAPDNESVSDDTDPAISVPEELASTGSQTDLLTGIGSLLIAIGLALSYVSMSPNLARIRL